MFEKILNVHLEDEYASSEDESGNTLNLAKIELSSAQIERIKHLSELVKENKLYCVKQFDYTPEYFYEIKGSDSAEETPFYDPQNAEETIEWQGRVECICLKVTSDSFQWDGYIKHTNIRWATDSVQIEDLP